MITTQSRRKLKQVTQLRIDFLLVLIESNAINSDSYREPPHPEDNMFTAPQGDVEEHVVETAQRELTQLTRTLTWLDSEQAGICEYCSESIPFERLKTVPDSRRCVACAGNNQT